MIAETERQRDRDREKGEQEEKQRQRDKETEKMTMTQKHETGIGFHSPEFLFVYISGGDLEQSSSVLMIASHIWS